MLNHYDMIKAIGEDHRRELQRSASPRRSIRSLLSARHGHAGWRRS
jgi:hypothetical protein